MKNMKNIVQTSGFVLGILVLFLASCQELGRIDQIDDSAPAPKAATVTAVEPIPGGAIVRFSIPSDENLLGVKVQYERNGEACESMASKFVDSLKIEGFGDTRERKGTIYSVGKNGKLSNGTAITFTPQTPAVQTAKFDIDATFGGVKVSLKDNFSNANLAIVILCDTLVTDDGKPAGAIEWEDLYTYHTSAEEMIYARRGLEAKEALFGVFLRDRWGNLSDTLYRKLEPMEEIYLPTGPWKIYPLPTDTYLPAEGLWNWYDPAHMWDGNFHGDMNSWASVVGPKEIWFTIDLGYTAMFSRAQMFHRNYDSEIYHGSAVRHFQVWGSNSPNPDGSWDDSWILLGDFIPKKPSGYDTDGTAGTVTPEDKDYFYNTNEFEFEQTEDVPDPYIAVRYVRVKLLDTFASWEASVGADPEYIASLKAQYVISEFILHGQIPDPAERDKYYIVDKD